MEAHTSAISHAHYDNGEDKPYDIFEYVADGRTIGRAHTYDHDTSRLHIDDIHVDEAFRRKRIGQALLAAIKEHAEPSYEHVTATIVSRECLQAMRRVFGDASISIRKEGEFDASSPQQDTSARLDYRT